MKTRRLGMAVLIGSLAALAVGGCIRRKETITVGKDGAVTIALHYEGDPKDFETADGLPSEKSGWKITKTTEKKDNGEEAVTLRSVREFAPREDLPRNFASKDDADADLYLDFPTTLRWEKRPDGEYLHFRRVYTPRPWAYVQFWQDELIDDSVKELGEKKPEELTTEQRIQVVQAFAGVELLKQLEFARTALREADPDLAQDAWMRARNALLQVGERADWSALIDRVADLSEEERYKVFEREAEQLLEDCQDAFVRTLRTAASYDDSKLARFEAAYARAKKLHAITSDLGTQRFDIQVKMPGEVVAHNGDKIEDDGSVSWDFPGKAFRDRSYELMVTAKLPDNRRER